MHCFISSSETGIAEKPHMYGDLLLSPEQEKQLLLSNEEEGVAQGFLVGANIWPGGVVPYELDPHLSKSLA